MSSWFNTGFKEKTSVSEKKEDRTQNPKVIQRFWVKPQGSENIVFLDDFTWVTDFEGDPHKVVPFSFYEHMVIPDKDFKNSKYFTCSGSDCPLCKAGYNRRIIHVLTIIKLWKNDKGKEVAIKQILAMPDTTAALVEGKLTKKSNLQGLLFSVDRTEAKSSKVGNVYDFQEDIKDKLKERFPHTDLTPFGLNAKEALEYYQKLFIPRPEGEIKHFLASYKCEDGYIPYNKNNVSSTPNKSTSTDNQGDKGEGDDIPY